LTTFDCLFLVKVFINFSTALSNLHLEHEKLKLLLRHSSYVFHLDILR